MYANEPNDYAYKFVIDDLDDLVMLTLRKSVFGTYHLYTKTYVIDIPLDVLLYSDL
jgi:hypothetical protein